jgi:hypothetical protein
MPDQKGRHSGMQTGSDSPIPALLLLDAERRILSATETAADLLHTTVGDLVGRRFDEIAEQRHAASGGIDDFVQRRDIIPGIHLALLRTGGPSADKRGSSSDD